MKNPICFGTAEETCKKHGCEKYDDCVRWRDMHAKAKGRRLRNEQ